MRLEDVVRIQYTPENYGRNKKAIKLLNEELRDKTEPPAIIRMRLLAAVREAQ